MKKLMILSTLLSFCGLTACNASIKDVDSKAFSKLVEKSYVQLVDCRTADEFALSHINGATLIDYKKDNFKEQALGKLDKSKTVAIYCRSGRRSRAAAEILAAEGFKVCNLKDGILSWKEEGFPTTKPLVLYYSQVGTTKAVAEEIAAQTGADIVAFDVTKPYDGTYDETIQRCLAERGAGIIPELKAPDCDLSQYDLIFLGYPIWFGTYAPPMKAMVASEKFAGKVIVPFCSFGSGGLLTSTADLKAALPDADIRDGYGVRTARVAAAAEELNRFLIENGWKEGEIDPLPDYSAQAPVTTEETAIFDQACSGYQFPLGTPVTAGSRKAPYGTDYLFTAESKGPDGQKSSSKIYVTVRDGKAEFTQVAR